MSDQDPSGRESTGEGLIASGIIIATLCGLCSGCVVIGGLNPSDPQAGIFLPLVPFVGGIPTAIGLVLIFLGHRMRRRRRSSPTKPANPHAES